MGTGFADIADHGSSPWRGTERRARTAGGPVRLLSLLLLTLATPATAWARQDRIGGPPPATVCVKVDIAGERAGDVECAAAQLQEAARLAQSQARGPLDVSVVGARSPDIRTGVASQTATRQRLGSSFGVSVHPQRPSRPPLPTRPGQP
ncbi:hypothetical protein CFHF_10890 [Caulobacter flavus]|uniref:UrcA family protein n=1 Tax=Caulobacter flavus TaxID=1679497 RepID=A0A2N5CU78_9CAUL|nr:hypothetical protein [Caulobacter flavus]AYV47985.1 hypothetical protein C1707_17920 [Caulobacter flavus]PLR16541.1 hypothetical protein CFHF_10890 [Caulobacter flavus]